VCPLLCLGFLKGATTATQDAALNELLPFGEFVPPERRGGGHAAAAHFLVDAWELERLLQRLSAAAPDGRGADRGSARYERRERRSRHRALAAAGALAGPTPGGATPPPGAPLAPEPSYASWVCYELSGSLAIRCEVAVHATELELQAV